MTTFGLPTGTALVATLGISWTRLVLQLALGLLADKIALFSALAQQRFDMFKDLITRRSTDMVLFRLFADLALVLRSDFLFAGLFLGALLCAR